MKDPFGNPTQNTLSAISAQSDINAAGKHLINEGKITGSDDDLDSRITQEAARRLLEPYREDL